MLCHKAPNYRTGEVINQFERERGGGRDVERERKGEIERDFGVWIVRKHVQAIICLIF